MMTIPLFVFSRSAEYRYVIWLIASTLLATILLVLELTELVRRRRQIDLKPKST